MAENLKVDEKALGENKDTMKDETLKDEKLQDKDKGENLPDVSNGRHPSIKTFDSNEMSYEQVAEYEKPGFFGECSDKA